MSFNNTSSEILSTTNSPYRQASEQHAVLRTGLGIISFLSFTGNGVLVLMFVKNRDMLKTPYSMFILSLAITDMTTGLGLILTPAYIIGTYNFPVPSGFAGELFCRIVASYFLVFYLGIVSVFTITCLALERWFAVARPAKYKASFGKTRVIAILALVWLCSLALNLPQTFEMTLGPTGSCVWVTLTEGWLRQVVAVIEFNGKFFIPLMVTSVSFINLGLRVKHSPALFKTNHGRAGIRLLRMCTVTAIVLAICWFPNQFYYLLFKFDITLMDTPIHHLTVIMCMGNSCVNPFIYCATNKSYRKRILNLFWFVGCCRKDIVEPLNATSESVNNSAAQIRREEMPLPEIS